MQTHPSPAHHRGNVLYMQKYQKILAQHTNVLHLQKGRSIHNLGTPVQEAWPQSHYVQAQVPQGQEAWAQIQQRQAL